MFLMRKLYELNINKNENVMKRNKFNRFRNYSDIIFPNILIPQDNVFGFVSVEVLNPSALWELHWTILSGREEEDILESGVLSPSRISLGAAAGPCRLDFELSCT